MIDPSSPFAVTHPVDLFSNVCDLSLVEARALRSGESTSIRRPVENPPIEVRRGLWSRYGSPVVTGTIERVRQAVQRGAPWQPGSDILLREPWAPVAEDAFGVASLVYRADEIVAVRGGADAPREAERGEWKLAPSLPEWAWRMNAHVLGVSVSMAELEQAGEDGTWSDGWLWSYVYELEVFGA